MNLEIIAAKIANIVPPAMGEESSSDVRLAIDLSKQKAIRTYLEDRASRSSTSKLKEKFHGEEYDVLVALAHTTPENYNRFMRDIKDLADIISPTTSQIASYEEVTRDADRYEKLKLVLDHLRKDNQFTHYSPLGAVGDGITVSVYRKLKKLLEIIKNFLDYFQEDDQKKDQDKLTPDALNNLIRKKYAEPSRRIWALNEIYRSVIKNPKAIMPEFGGAKKLIEEEYKKRVKDGDPWDVLFSYGVLGKDYNTIRDVTIMPWLQKHLLDVLAKVAVSLMPNHVQREELPTDDRADRISRGDQEKLLHAYIPIRLSVPYRDLVLKVAKEPQEAFNEGNAALDLSLLRTMSDFDKNLVDEYLKTFFPPGMLSTTSAFFRSLPQSVKSGTTGTGILKSAVPGILKFYKDLLENPDLFLDKLNLFETKLEPEKTYVSEEEEPKFTQPLNINDRQTSVFLNAKNLASFATKTIPTMLRTNNSINFKVEDPKLLKTMVQYILRTKSYPDDLLKEMSQRDKYAYGVFAHAIAQYEHDPKFRYSILPTSESVGKWDIRPSYENEFRIANPGIDHIHKMLVGVHNRGKAKEILNDAESNLYNNELKTKKRWLLNDTLNYIKKVGIANIPFDYHNPRSGLKADLQSLADQIQLEVVQKDTGEKEVVPFFRQNHMISRKSENVKINSTDKICNQLASVLTEMKNGNRDGGMALVRLNKLIKDGVIKNKDRFEAVDAYQFIVNRGMSDFTRDPVLMNEDIKNNTNAATKSMALLSTLGKGLSLSEAVDSYIKLNSALGSPNDVDSILSSYKILTSDDLSKFLGPYIYTKVSDSSYAVPKDLKPAESAHYREDFKNLVKAVKTVHAILTKFGGEESTSSKQAAKGFLGELVRLMGDRVISNINAKTFEHEVELLGEDVKLTDDLAAGKLIDESSADKAKKIPNANARSRTLSGKYLSGIDLNVRSAVDEFEKSPSDGALSDRLRQLLDDGGYQAVVRPGMSGIAKNALFDKPTFMDHFKHSSVVDPYKYLRDLKSISGFKPKWDSKDLVLVDSDFDLPGVRPVEVNVEEGYDRLNGDLNLPVIRTMIDSKPVAYVLEDELSHLEDSGLASRIREVGDKIHLEEKLGRNKSGQRMPVSLYVVKHNDYPPEMLNSMIEESNKSSYGEIFQGNDFNALTSSVKGTVDPGSLSSAVLSELYELASPKKVFQLKSETNYSITEELETRKISVDVLVESGNRIKSQKVLIPVWKNSEHALFRFLYILKMYDASKVIAPLSPSKQKPKPEQAYRDILEFMSFGDMNKVISILEAEGEDVTELIGRSPDHPAILRRKLGGWFKDHPNRSPKDIERLLISVDSSNKKD